MKKGYGVKICFDVSPKVKRVVKNFWESRGMTVTGAITEYVVNPALEDYMERVKRRREKEKRDGKE